MKETIFHIRCGHTLCELVIALFIIGICMATAAPKLISSLDNSRSKATVKRVQADIQYARHLARRTGQEQKIVFSVQDNSYRLDRVAHLNYGSREYAVGMREYEFHLSDGDNRAVLIEADFDGSSELIFTHSGRPKAEGTVTIRYGDSHPMLLVVNPSGHVTLSPSDD